MTGAGLPRHPAGSHPKIFIYALVHLLRHCSMRFLGGLPLFLARVLVFLVWLHRAWLIEFVFWEYQFPALSLLQFDLLLPLRSGLSRNDSLNAKHELVHLDERRYPQMRRSLSHS